jgi:prephenate dehydrogenase
VLGAFPRITDMVSVKAPVVRSMRDAGLAPRFVGAHPICGGAGSGFAAGSADLFDDATVWLCAGSETSSETKEEIARFWAAVGARPKWTDAAEHDRRMAWVSHLPQLLANALAGALDSAGYTRSELGPGGRDMTRLAGSNPEIWRDLLEVSAPVTGVGITSVSNALNVLADLLARREMDRIAEFMERTRTWARSEE